MATVHAPQSPSAQPSLLPVCPFDRRYVRSETWVDSPVTTTERPLRMKEKDDAIGPVRIAGAAAASVPFDEVFGGIDAPTRSLDRTHAVLAARRLRRTSNFRSAASERVF